MKRFFSLTEVRRMWAWMRALYAIAGVALVVTGCGYLPITPTPPTLPKGLELISEVIPIWVWGIPWLIAGLLCIASAWADLRPPWMARSASLAVVICLAWAVAYLAGAFFGGDRAYISVAAYLICAVMLLGFSLGAKYLRPMVRSLV